MRRCISQQERKGMVSSKRLTSFLASFCRQILLHMRHCVTGFPCKPRSPGTCYWRPHHCYSSGCINFIGNNDLLFCYKPSTYIKLAKSTWRLSTTCQDCFRDACKGGVSFASPLLVIHCKSFHYSFFLNLLGIDGLMMMMNLLKLLVSISNT